LKVFRHIADLQVESKSSDSHIITIGNFDGCHLGHQKLVTKTLELAHRSNSRGLCLTFDPNPKYFFNPEKTPAQLFTMKQKIQAFQELGMGEMLIQSFDAAFKATTAADFYRSYLRTALHAKGIVIGQNFYFGKDRQGSPSYLQNLAKADGMTLEVVSSEIHDGEAISSTRIRQVLAETGAVDQAWAMLGRPYCLLGIVNAGKKIGRQLGFPTINLSDIEQVKPSNGVYVGLVWLEGTTLDPQPSLLQPQASKLLPAVINIGHRPTLQNDSNIVIEAHLLVEHADLQKDLTSRQIAIYFLSRLREERRFNGADALKNQIQQDVQAARHILATCHLPPQTTE